MSKVIGYASVRIDPEVDITVCCINLKRSGIGIVSNDRCVCGEDKRDARQEKRKPKYRLVELREVKR